MKKPHLHVIDTIDDPGAPKSIRRRIDELRPFARRFIFDAEASRHVGRFIRDCGDLLIENRQFAIPPYQTTYIEFDLEALLAAIGKGCTTEIFGKDGTDKFIGYLIHGNRVTVIVCGDTGSALIGAFGYRLNTPIKPRPIFATPMNPADPNDEWARISFLLGTMVDDLPDELTRQEIIGNVEINVTWDGPFDDRRRKTLLLGAMGELRMLWACLLMLNQHKHIELEQVPHQTGLYKGKRCVCPAHHLVRIHLGQTTSIRKMLSSTLGIPRRRHEVRGHFAHWHLKDGCEHQWPPLPDFTVLEGEQETTPRWRCTSCGGLRVWRKAHVRGRGGFVTKEYVVTDSVTDSVTGSVTDPETDSGSERSLDEVRGAQQ